MKKDTAGSKHYQITNLFNKFYHVTKNQRHSREQRSPEERDHKISSFRRIFHSLDFINPKSVDEDVRRHEYLLNIILVSFIGLLSIFGLLIVFNFFKYGDDYHGVYPFLFLGIFTIFLSLFYLSKRGFIKTASYLLVALYGLSATYGALTWGFDTPSVIISYLLVITLTSTLISTKNGVAATIILGLLVVFIGFYQIRIAMPLSYWRNEKPELIDIISYTAQLIFILTISNLSRAEKDKSLKRARHSEELLQKELGRINRLYHFAEFGKISSGVFHDLMNPLSSVVLNVEDIDSGDTKIKDIKENIVRAKHSALKLSQLMENINKQIKIDNQIKDFDVGYEIKQAIDLLSYKTVKANCIIEFKYSRIILKNDQNKFFQIITNLISNAIDSYDGLETLTKRVVVRLGRDEKEITIQIQDWGSGISQDKQEHIFEPFYTTKSFEKGTGLGLSITKENIEKIFKGNIGVQSEENKGTTFTICIPAL